MLGLTAFLNGRAKTLRKSEISEKNIDYSGLQSYTNSEDLTIPQIYKREREKLCNITFLGVQGDTRSHYTRLVHPHTQQTTASCVCYW